MNESSLRSILAKLGIQVQGKSGDWVQASCPFSSFFHSSGKDLHPSFVAKIDPHDSSYYYCHACKMHGRISSLARALGHHRHNSLLYYNVIIAEADQADQENVIFSDYEDRFSHRDSPQEPLVEEIFDNMYECPIRNQEAIDYLTSRGISSKTALDLGVRYDERQGRILFPVRGLGGSLYGFTGRSTYPDVSPKIRDYAGLKKRQHILGSHRWREDKRPLIIVEGLFGYAHLVELNVEKVADVGAILGSTLSDKKRDLIIDRNTRTILLIDDDEAGDLCLFGRNGAIDKLSRQNFPVYAPVWPANKIDPDQLTKHEIWQIIQGKVNDRRSRDKN